MGEENEMAGDQHRQVNRTTGWFALKHKVAEGSTDHYYVVTGIRTGVQELTRRARWMTRTQE